MVPGTIKKWERALQNEYRLVSIPILKGSLKGGKMINNTLDRLETF